VTSAEEACPRSAMTIFAPWSVKSDPDVGKALVTRAILTHNIMIKYNNILTFLATDFDWTKLALNAAYFESLT
jgi:hypothetical protein